MAGTAMDNELMRRTCDVITAHLSNNPVSSDELPSLIRRVSKALRDAREGRTEAENGAEEAPAARAPADVAVTEAPAPKAAAPARAAEARREESPAVQEQEQEPKAKAKPERRDEPATAAEPEKPIPAVPIEESVKPDAIICLEDGRPFKMMKRYLRAQYNMTPEQYRAKWGLPDDYPMVAPNYSEEKRQYAKHVGLGTEKLGRPKPRSAKARAVA